MSVAQKTHLSTAMPVRTHLPFGPPGTGIHIPRSADEMSEEALARYFADRELVERTMSRSATDPRVAEIHSELAERYEALALVFGGKRTEDPPIYC